ncbi:non-ribosomal peptide synthetase [Nocardia arthritidis]|nr:non-ribosomal peptide synthetase [Nocardia arthritidis]
MSEVWSLLNRLRADGVQLWTHEGRLRYSSEGALDTDLLVQIRKRKPEIIALLEGAVSDPPLGSIPRSATLPMSLTQEGLWFLEQLGVVGSAYNVVTAVRIEGALDVPVLRRAVREIVRRHEILRTRFRSVDGVGSQLVASDEVQFEVTETSTPDVRAIIRKHAERQFNLEHDDLFVVEVARLAAEEYLLVINAHHLIYDGTSSGIFFRELQTLYAAYLQGISSPLPEPTVQYADFSIWQRQRLKGDNLDYHLKYWRNRLDGAPDSLDLPLDHPRPSVPDFKGDLFGFYIPALLMESLTALGRRHQATLAMVLLAGYHALLSSWSGQTDISVGLPVDGRVHPETEGLIGYFLSTVVVRTDLSAVSSFAELLRQVRVRVLEGYEHRDLPFHQLVAGLGPGRRNLWQPLFQVMFSHLIQETPGLDSLTLTMVEPEDSAAKFDLSLFVAETPEGVVGSFEYAASLFDRDTIARLSERYLLLLRAVAATPDTPIGELDLLSDAERQMVLVTWNATEMAADSDRCLHALFEDQANRQPDRTIVEFEGQTLTYAALEARANQVANRLRALGACPERPVAIRAERSLDLVAGLLGILKSGAPYVPIDPGYPLDRQTLMISDSGASILLSQRSLLSQQSVAPDLSVITLDDPGEWSGWPIDRPQPVASSDNLAYLIYTSGSTGGPKGVAVTHRAVVGRIEGMQRSYALDSSDAVLQKTPISFDVSLWEIFWPLISGARLVLAAPGGQRDPAYLCELIERRQITTAHFVPSMLAAFLADESASGSCRSLRRVICSGEELSRELTDRFFEIFGCELYNRYGPTEATIEVSSWPCGRGEQGRVPIGRPVSNTTLYVLDDRMRPTPIGVAGELFIGGTQLARGYIGRPGLTAASFVPDPYGPPGSRLYRSGDLVKARSDGAMEFLGRLDHQVKIRGYRVELGEIENALRAVPGVTDAAVVAHELRPGDRRLVGYVARVGELSMADLRSRLRKSLPEYMVPVAFVPLDQLPLTTSGKLDRRALPLPDAESFDSGFVAPRTPRERLLAQIWCEVLSIERVGVLDSFFSVGGHSLLATQVVTRVRERLGAVVTLREFYSMPTVADLARLTEAAGKVGAMEPGIHLGYIPRRFEPDKWLRRLTPAGSLVVFVLPGAGMGPSALRGWQVSNPAGVEVVAIHLPGREERIDEPVMTHIDPLADQIARSIDTYSDRPYIVFGHSAGALIGYEVVRRTARPPLLFAVAAAPPPSLAADNTDATDGELLESLADSGVVPPEILKDPSAVSMFLPPLRADLSVSVSCRRPLIPTELPGIPIHAFAGSADDAVLVSDCAAWANWTSAAFRLHMIDGGHFFAFSHGEKILSALVEAACGFHRRTVSDDG